MSIGFNSLSNNDNISNVASSWGFSQTTIASVYQEYVNSRQNVKTCHHDISLGLSNNSALLSGQLSHFFRLFLDNSCVDETARGYGSILLKRCYASWWKCFVMDVRSSLLAFTRITYPDRCDIEKFCWRPFTPVHIHHFPQSPKGWWYALVR